ncbi:BLUF domain-containing protein [Agaribacter marinus]|uniref:BLUF domain-containing protein n=1 Tax=Agaribacter marinus TaxID=1431249 RepID=A0AA37SZS0_9ALTE|nr:BLUF domain-containing protein [Agaribacter marinus]GLR69608.1 hypothetical protein GCM10007852_05160 [Agaribacter marinus]
MNIELVYMSRAKVSFTTDDLFRLLESARANNKKCSITGMLLFDGSSTFIQVLEGHSNQVNALFASIQQDHRHENIELLSKRMVFSRNFPDWSMGFKKIKQQSREGKPMIEGFNHFLEANNDSQNSDKGIGLSLLEHFKKELNST